MGNQRNTTIHRGDIYLADLAPVVGSEQGGIRPVLIIQNDIGNQHSPTVITAVITGQIKHRHLILCRRPFMMIRESWER